MDKPYDHMNNVRNADKLRLFYDQLTREELCRMYEAVNREAELLALEIIRKV